MLNKKMFTLLLLFFLIFALGFVTNSFVNKKIQKPINEEFLKNILEKTMKGIGSSGKTTQKPRTDFELLPLSENNHLRIGAVKTGQIISVFAKIDTTNISSNLLGTSEIVGNNINIDIAGVKSQGEWGLHVIGTSEIKTIIPLQNAQYVINVRYWEQVDQYTLQIENETVKLTPKGKLQFSSLEKL